MKFETTPNGSLLIQAEKDDAQMLVDLKERCGENDLMFLSELLEVTGWQGNGQLIQVNPEDVGALTDAPMLTDDCRIEDDGEVLVPGNVWWFPNYMITNFANQLVEQGKTLFSLGSPALTPA